MATVDSQPKLSVDERKRNLAAVIRDCDEALDLFDQKGWQHVRKVLNDSRAIYEASLHNLSTDDRARDRASVACAVYESVINMPHNILMLRKQSQKNLEKLNKSPVENAIDNIFHFNR